MKVTVPYEPGSAAFADMLIKNQRKISEVQEFLDMCPQLTKNQRISLKRRLLKLFEVKTALLGAILKKEIVDTEEALKQYGSDSVEYHEALEAREVAVAYYLGILEERNSLKEELSKAETGK